MGYDNIILTVNAVSVIILVMLALLLCFATRFKGESSYAALITVLSTVPVCIYNVCRSVGWYEAAFMLAPLSYSVDLTLMPLLWSLVHKAFNPRYRFTFKTMLHFFPALLMLVLFSVSIFTLPVERHYVVLAPETIDDGTWLSTANVLFLFAQLVGYPFVIFRYLHKVKRYIRDHYSEAELIRKVWVPRFVTLFAAMFLSVNVCYIFWPRTDAWLLQLLTVIVMGYLLYSELDVALSSRYRLRFTADAVAEAEADFLATEVNPLPVKEDSKEDLQRLEQYARQVVEYLVSSEAYTNPDLSLKDVAKATGLSSKKLSRAINAVLDKSFFDLVNGLRVERSKAMLLSKKEKGYTLDVIAEHCGFNSRFTFNAAFKKAMGVTTTGWLQLSKK